MVATFGVFPIGQKSKKLMISPDSMNKFMSDCLTGNLSTNLKIEF